MNDSTCLAELRKNLKFTIDYTCKKQSDVSLSTPITATSSSDTSINPHTEVNNLLGLLNKVITIVPYPLNMFVNYTLNIDGNQVISTKTCTKHLGRFSVESSVNFKHCDLMLASGLVLGGKINEEIGPGCSNYKTPLLGLEVGLGIRSKGHYGLMLKTGTSLHIPPLSNASDLHYGGWENTHFTLAFNTPFKLNVTYSISMFKNESDERTFSSGMEFQVSEVCKKVYRYFNKK